MHPVCLAAFVITRISILPDSLLVSQLCYERTQKQLHLLTCGYSDEQGRQVPITRSSSIYNTAATVVSKIKMTQRAQTIETAVLNAPVI